MWKKEQQSEKKGIAKHVKRRTNASKNDKRIVASNRKDNYKECENMLLEKKVGLKLELGPLFILVLGFF